MKELLISTRSKGKFPEIVAALHGLTIELLNLNDIALIPEDFEVEESATTFEGHAILKANTYAGMTGLVTLAEDSGLCVDVLDGKPGVYSARYSEGIDEERCRMVLDELKGVSPERRTAQYVAVVAIYDPNTDRLRTCEGVCEGSIALQPIGSNGFGYDPIFFSPTFNKTMAQLSIKEKNCISHRGRALEKAREILIQEFIS
jgi:XTP/dITP diphosphohydrolase